VERALECQWEEPLWCPQRVGTLVSTSLSHITSRQDIKGVPAGVLRRREGPVCGGRGLQAGTLFSPAFPSHPHRPYVSSCTMSCPIDFPFHVSLTLLTLHPPEMVTPALLHTSAHTTPGYTLPMSTLQVVGRRKPPWPGVGRGERGTLGVIPQGLSLFL